jgi:hypothetical protein
MLVWPTLHPPFWTEEQVVKMENKNTKCFHLTFVTQLNPKQHNNLSQMYAGNDSPRNLHGRGEL